MVDYYTKKDVICSPLLSAIVNLCAYQHIKRSKELFTDVCHTIFFTVYFFHVVTVVPFFHFKFTFELSLSKYSEKLNILKPFIIQ